MDESGSDAVTAATPSTPRSNTAPRSAPQRCWSWLRVRLGEQWIFAAVLGLVWCADVLLALSAQQPIVLPGITVIAALAILGWRSPLLSGLATALVLAGQTTLLHFTEPPPYGVGLVNVLPTENAAGVLLVCYAFWKRPAPRASLVTATLVVSCLVAVFLRVNPSQTMSSPTFQNSTGLGLLELVLAIGSGLYLRDTPTEPARGPIRALLRRQWLLIAALSVFVLLQLNASWSDMSVVGVVFVAGTVAVSLLAIFAPLVPVRAALLGALTTVLMAMPVALEAGHTIPVAAVPAGMVLISSTTRYGERRAAVLSVGALVLAALFASLAVTNELPNTWIVGGLLIVVAAGTGMYLRNRDLDRARSVRAAVTDAQQTERLALARELHDLVAHHMTGIVVQAQAAQLVAHQNPQAAADSLERIATSGTEALAAMRRLVSSMRVAGSSDHSEGTDQATTDLNSDLSAVVAKANQGFSEHGPGRRVELATDIDRQVPHEVARSALRVVQEATTNSAKHALDVTSIQVSVRATEDYLHVHVADDGSDTRAHPVGGSGGYGLVGMRERIELLGGRFSAGPGDHVGWWVDAWLPLSEWNGERHDPGADR